MHEYRARVHAVDANVVGATSRWGLDHVDERRLVFVVDVPDPDTGVGITAAGPVERAGVRIPVVGPDVRRGIADVSFAAADDVEILGHLGERPA